MDNQKRLVELMNMKMGCKEEFPKFDELGNRPVNRSESKIHDYYQDEENKIFEEIYKKDVKLYKAVSKRE